MCCMGMAVGPRCALTRPRLPSQQSAPRSGHWTAAAGAAWQAWSRFTCLLRKQPQHGLMNPALLAPPLPGRCCTRRASSALGPSWWLTPPASGACWPWRACTRQAATLGCRGRNPSGSACPGLQAGRRGRCGSHTCVVGPLNGDSQKWPCLPPPIPSWQAYPGVPIYVRALDMAHAAALQEAGAAPCSAGAPGQGQGRAVWQAAPTGLALFAHSGMAWHSKNEPCSKAHCPATFPCLSRGSLPRRRHLGDFSCHRGGPGSRLLPGPGAGRARQGGQQPGRRAAPGKWP